MRRVDRLWLAVILGELEHRTRNLILLFRRELAHSVQRLFQELRHRRYCSAKFGREESAEGCAMPMKNPPHPGETVRHDCLEPWGLSVTEAAKALGVTRQALNGKSGISPDMAIRLEKAFGGSASVWLGLQMDYDLAQAMK